VSTIYSGIHKPVALKKTDTKLSSKRLWKNMWAARYLYVLVLPLMLYYLFFHYIPMYGLLLAFKELNFVKGITASGVCCDSRHID
jgi:putative aldouronate transport system permease protein